MVIQQLLRLPVLDPTSVMNSSMETVNMKGHWIGLFSSHNGITSIDFTENITPKKFFMKPFVKRYLKKTASCLYS